MVYPRKSPDSRKGIKPSEIVSINQKLVYAKLSLQNIGIECDVWSIAKVVLENEQGLDKLFRKAPKYGNVGNRIIKKTNVQKIIYN